MSAELTELVWAKLFTEAVIESAGLIWIGAELAILYYVNIALRFLRPKNAIAVKPSRKTGRALSVLFLVLTLATFGRHILIVPMPIVFATGGLGIPDIQHHVSLAAMAHSIVWTCFITLWVLLELAIVYRGIQVYRSLRSVLSKANP